METETETFGLLTLLKCGGKFTLDDGVPKFKNTFARLINDGRLYFVIDLENITRFDSSAIGALVSLMNIIDARKGKMVFARVPKKVMEAFAITKLDQHFKFFEDNLQATEFFKSQYNLTV
jgi:anti-anti-sigma factor